ncbi:hypothetical protein INH39_26635 [Massilia violaceinigra]|uniref:Uncharacterized protein n=1 Tax=Massilia violaceinigra TaxID=2045208 RepID=A0ABY4A5Z1_9BURK|nr:hypothetical protein [Massilia violaceinigra]UOD28976.1 hypothetical protein INH39_26635 [Massilia violaceinigra]
MNAYARVYELLALPAALRACALGAIALPVVGAEAPAYWYGFPPALIPLWSEPSGPLYYGCWKHWFIDREPTFVKAYVECPWTMLEVARTPAQLFALAAISAIVDGDAVTPQVEAFARKVGIDNLAQIDSVSLDTGDDAAGLVRLDQFAAAVPLACCPDPSAYGGSFPLSTQPPPAHALARTCQFELDIDALSGWLADPACPPWLATRAQSKLALCRGYIAQGAFALAWLSINARGWSIGEARSAVAELAAAAADPQFDLLASAWLALASDSAGGY